jgi:hypothetical protein
MGLCSCAVRSILLHFINLTEGSMPLWRRQRGQQRHTLAPAVLSFLVRHLLYRETSGLVPVASSRSTVP